MFLIIREFRKEDTEDIMECAMKSFVDEFDITGFDPDNWRKMIRRRFSVAGRTLFGLFKLLGKEPIKFFVAEMNGKVVGTTMLSRRRSSCYISTVMTHPDFRRKGVALALLKTVVDYTRDRKLGRAILHVSSTNGAAKDLYCKLGFVKFEESVYLAADIDSLIDSEKAEEVIQVMDFKRLDEETVYELIKHARDAKSLEVLGFQKEDLRTPWWGRIVRLGTVKRIVAVKDEKTAGYASVTCTSNREAGRITNLDVFPEMISNGIAEQLVRACANHVKKSCGTKTILVVVALGNEELVRKLENLGLKRRLTFEGMVSA